MKSSELIRQLAETITREGDREVLLNDDIRCREVDVIYREGGTCIRLSSF